MAQTTINPVIKRLRVWRRFLRRGLLLRYFSGRLLVALGLSRRFYIRRDGYVLRFFPSALSLALWTNPRDFCDDEQFLRCYLRSSDIAVDVGANIGTVALAAANAVGKNGKVIAVEAHPRTFTYLCENIRLNQMQRQVEAFNVACGGQTGQLWFSDQALLLDCRNHVKRRGEGIEVAEWPLDSLTRGVSRVALLKIDVEGYEKFVLEGATDLLSRTEAVLFESCEAHFQKYEYTTNDVLDLLRSRGFDLFRFGTALPLSPLPTRYMSEVCENLLAIRPHALTRLEHAAIDSHFHHAVTERELTTVPTAE